MVFKDRTYCPFLKCTKKDCDRRLTKKIESKAKKANLPISQFMDKPECYKGK